MKALLDLIGGIFAGPEGADAIARRIRAQIHRENLQRLRSAHNGVRPAGLTEHQREAYLRHRTMPS